MPVFTEARLRAASALIVRHMGSDAAEALARHLTAALG